MPETHKVGPHQITLTLPASVSIKWDIVRAAANNSDRAFAAALAACWDGPGRPKAKYAAFSYNPLPFGGAVMDELAARGVPVVDIVNVGAVAWKLICDAMVPADEVEEQAGFSGPTPPTPSG